MTSSSEEYNRHRYIRIPYQLMLIVAVILAAYYPIAFGDFSRIDDHTIIEAVSNMGPKDVPGLFIPHSQYGAYYRPVLFLSFLLDKYLFNLDPGFMHLHNIILHAINALLIFWLAFQLIPDRTAGKSLIPLLSALIFGLHPIATEPVSWIAGRTDVLACTFILLSANCLIRFRKTASYWYIALSALFMGLGFLTKEVALAFLPGAFLLVASPLYPESETVSKEGTLPQDPLRRYHRLPILLFGSGAVLLFFLLRHFAFESNSGRIVATFRFLRNDIIRDEFIFLQALGFYVKKIFFPFPLNFAITDVNPLYELLGVPVVVLCFLVGSKRSKLSALFMTGIILIAPSFVIALGQMAWTSFAERYMYLPTAFIMVASVFFINSLLKKTPLLSRVVQLFDFDGRSGLDLLSSTGQVPESGMFNLDSPSITFDNKFHGNNGIQMKGKRPLTRYAVRKEVFITILLVVMAVATFHRSTVWKDSFSFLKDTVEKNPVFPIIRAEYADELAVRGDIKNARIQYTIANEFNERRKRMKHAGDFVQLQYWELPQLGLADLLAREHKIPEAIAAYEKIIRDADAGSTESMQALNNVIILYDGLLDSAKNRSASDTIKRKLLFYSEKYYKQSDDANAFYWLGRRFLMRGNKQEALAYFRKAESKFSADNKYKIISQKFIAWLEKK